MEILRTHEYDISLVRGGHWEGPHVFGFWFMPFPYKYGAQCKGPQTMVKGIIFLSTIL